MQITEMRDTHTTVSYDGKPFTYIRKEQLDTEHVSHKPDNLHDIDKLSESIAQIFGRNYLEPHELRALRKRMPIAANEIALVTRFYQLPPSYFDFALSRRRKSPSTLLDHWTEEVDQAAYYFKANGFKWNEEWGPIPQVRFLAS